MPAVSPLLRHVVVQRILYRIGDGGPACLLVIHRLRAVGDPRFAMLQGERPGKDTAALTVLNVFLWSKFNWFLILGDGFLHPAVHQLFAQRTVFVHLGGFGPGGHGLLGDAILGARYVGIEPLRVRIVRRPVLEPESDGHILQVSLEGGGLPGLVQRGCGGLGQAVGDGAIVIDAHVLISAAVTPVVVLRQRIGTFLQNRVAVFVIDHVAVLIHLVGAEHLLIRIPAPRHGLFQEIDIGVAVRVVLREVYWCAVLILDGQLVPV